MSKPTHWESTFEVVVSSVSRKIGLAAACAGNPRDVRRIGRWVWRTGDIYDGTKRYVSGWEFEQEPGIRNLTLEDLLAIAHLKPTESPIKTVGTLMLGVTAVAENQS